MVAVAVPKEVTTPSKAPAKVSFSVAIGRLVAGLKAVGPFVCQDETRYHLNRVAIQLSTGTLPTLQFIATDGHTLGWAQVEIRYSTAFAREQAKEQLPDNSPVGVLKPEAVQTLIRALKHRKHDGEIPVTVTLSNGRMNVSDATGLECSVAFDAKGLSSFSAFDEREKNTFPRWQQVVPERRNRSYYTNAWRSRKGATDPSPAAGITMLNPRYLMRAGKAALDFLGPCHRDGMEGMEISVGDTALDPCRIDVEHPDCGAFVVVIMPMRMGR